MIQTFIDSSGGYMKISSLINDTVLELNKEIIPTSSVGSHSDGYG